ncbi:MAG: hypothetical protein MJZ60_04910 [Bacteroidaceae bacterium]|nr:hypothetical protein [Bacteroidaceae bacterium]
MGGGGRLSGETDPLPTSPGRGAVTDGFTDCDGIAMVIVIVVKRIVAKAYRRRR